MLFPPQDELPLQKPKQETADMPLAEQLRPTHADEILGQESIWGLDGSLRRLVASERYHALIFWGPPGSGKTSVGQLIGQTSQRPLVCLSAVQAGVKDIRTALSASALQQQSGKKASLLFLDEVHRLNKAQQDILLPAVEEGSIKFIGATTENPSFEVNAALLSRCLVFRFEKISQHAMLTLLKKGLAYLNRERTTSALWDEAVLQAIAEYSGGDARRGLNLLEAIDRICHDQKTISIDTMRSLKGILPLTYDKKGDHHYDNISALIKSIRASHPDAALYYLARMLEAGEDPMFIARRLLISAAEDIGNANPHALSFATAAAQAVMMIGMPEARIILAQICTLLASSPKSNRAYVAIDKALDTLRKTGPLEVPLHLRNAPNALMAAFGYSEGYAYPHEEAERARKATYLPKELKGYRFYEPSEQGFEQNIRQTLARLRPEAD